MYGIEANRKDGGAVIYRFASLTARDAWVLSGTGREPLEDDELDGLTVGPWGKRPNLPAGAILVALVELPVGVDGTSS